MGGAVATGTHGSTMHYGSLSSQVLYYWKRGIHAEAEEVARRMLHDYPSGYHKRRKELCMSFWPTQS
jgi:hypothetical protein